jgi:hypothetical protein
MTPKALSVVNIHPRKRGQKVEPRQTVLTKPSEFQQKLISILELQKEPDVSLG